MGLDASSWEGMGESAFLFSKYDSLGILCDWIDGGAEEDFCHSLALHNNGEMTLLGIYTYTGSV